MMRGRKQKQKKKLKLKRKFRPPVVTEDSARSNAAPTTSEADAAKEYFSREFVMDEGGFFSAEDKASLMKLSDLSRWKILDERFEQKEQQERRCKMKNLADKIAVVRSKCKRSAIGTLTWFEMFVAM